mgnify:FL=1
MAKITSDTNLIRGAAAVGQSMMPTDLSGLDEVTKVGMDLMEKNIKQRKEVEKRFDDASEGVLLKSGALGGKLYESAIADTKKLRELYIDGVNTKDEKKKMDAMVGLQNLSIFVQDHKQTNVDIAKLRSKGDLSSYYEKNARGREKANIIAQIQDQAYSSVTANKEGDKVFHVKGLNDEIIEVSNKEYKEMASTLRNYKTGNEYIKTLSDAKRSELFEEDIFRQGVKQGLPKTKGEWNAAAYDDISGTNLEEMLNKSGTLDQEILMSVGGWDKNKNNKLDKGEKAAFIDAVLNTENDFFDLGVSNQILEDQLTNAGRSSHDKHWESKNAKKEEILRRTGNSGKTTTEQEYIKSSRLKAEAIDKMVQSKITLEGVKALSIGLGPRASYKTLEDGKIQILDAQNNPYIIDPNKPLDARSTLYNLSSILERHRDDQIMGIAKDPNKVADKYYNMLNIQE